MSLCANTRCANVDVADAVNVADVGDRKHVRRYESQMSLQMSGKYNVSL